ncbi:hypothetical protein HWV62_29561 [Athelia sp. TMB]|nr:hypothetical protein HWV62_29561 [Athelia sp. TMB]
MMNPLRQKKIDISSLSEEEQKLFRLYGKLPTHKNVLTKMQKDRKYFDSGDYALSKAGVEPQNAVGTAIPNPENIPHASPSPVNSSHQNLSVSPTNSTMSPVKESSLAHEQLEPKTEDVDTNMSAPEAPTPALTNIVAEPEMDAAGMDIAEPIAEPAPEAVDDGGE